VPVLNWLTNNPTKRPNYVILFYGVPASTCVSTNFCAYAFGGPSSSSYVLHRNYPNRQPFVTHINMRTPQECFAYVDKLAHFGSNYSPGRVYISPTAGGYGNTNYFFDDVRVPRFPDALGLQGSNGVVSFGGSTSQITYVGCTNVEDSACLDSQLIDCTNVTAYLSWGYHGGKSTGFPTNGNYRFHGNSGWYVIQTIESFNGQWVPGNFQTSFHDYFTASAFWGTSYSHTPAGAVTHTDEPALHGVANSFVYFGLWQAKKSFAICAWAARQTDVFQAVGDPFTLK
jgi:hypothetical protein